ncbi:MAG: ATP-binding cassette domain-containing protein [Alistipes sp.]|nr:ATP-binding cassette domain-containing protein [Alistipes sp.]
MSLYVDIEKQCGDFHLKVCFETEKEIFAILGSSGCGKSLTLKCIAGIETPDKGVISLDGRVLFDGTKKINIPARKREIGYLFQDYALFPNMTVFQNIMCGAKDKERTEKYIDRFYLRGKENLYPFMLSGGQKQRTALARMLAAGPKFLLLDEPFSALDNYLKMQLEREIMNIFDGYGKNALFVSHDRNEVYRLTDRIAVMENGCLADIQSKRELFDAPKTLAAALLTGCKNVTELTKKGEGWYFAADWGTDLHLQEEKTEGKPYAYAGIRAHFLALRNEDGANRLECEVVRVIEDTFSTVVLLKKKGSGASGGRSVITCELPKEEWERMGKDRLFVEIPTEKLILMEK